MYLVFFIGIEEKFQNMEKTIQTLRQILEKEPFYTINKYYNVGSFQKELEFALFPNLYPNSEGGFNTKTPDLKKVQLVLDIMQSEKINAINYAQNLRSVREQTKQEIYQEMRQILNSNKMNFGLELNDFTARQLHGRDQIEPNRAIFNIVDEEFINENQSMTYVFKMQKLSALQYEQARKLAENDEEVEQHLPQIIDIEFKAVNDFLLQTVAENHILGNLDNYLKRNEQEWDNEIKQFKKQMTKEKAQLKRKKKSENEIQTFVIEQERLLVNQKIKQLAQNENLIQIVKKLKSIVSFDLNSDISSEESDQDNLRRENLNRLHRQIRNNFQNLEELNTDNLNENERELTREERAQIEKAKQELAYFNRKNIALSQDTKWRLKCTFTKEFRKNASWIFWRYYEWIKQEFYCYQLIVNNQKGITQGDDEHFSIPPIRGSETQLTEYFHQIQKFSFEKGDPLMMLTITLNEFNEKTFKMMRGINQFDLQNEQKVNLANRKTLRDPEIIELAHDFVEYMMFLLKCYKKVLLNKFGKKKQLNNKLFKHYNYGLFGNCHSLVTRVEYQERGAIHFHMFIFIQVDDNGEVDEELLKYLQGLFSMYNITQVKKDKAFIEKYKLTHQCNKKCLKENNGRCRDGFPYIQEKGEVKKRYPTVIRQRRVSKEDSRIITFNKETVLHFNSNCQIFLITHVSAYAYLTKYFSKSQNKQKEENNLQRATEEEDREESKIMAKIKEFYDTKITHLQEAYLAFQSVPIIDQTYKVIKIRQQQMSFQTKFDFQPIEALTEEEIEENFKFNNLSNNWFQYLNRSNEFEDLNFIEYVTNTINYGKKENYKTQINNQINNQEIRIENYQYFYDLNGNVIKLREKQDNKKITIIQTTHLHPSPDYQGPDNIFYLQMLQLYLPHRKDMWIRKTKNSFEGYKQTYEELLETFTYEIDDNSVRTIIRKRFAKYQEYPLRNYVNEYLNIKPRQKRMLENIYRFAFNLKKNQDGENVNEDLPIIRQEFIEQILITINQQLEVEFEYQNANYIKTLIDIFNPITIKDELMIAQLTDLQEDLKNDVKYYWKELNLNTKNMLTNLALLYKEYGSTELYELIPNHQNAQIRLSKKAIQRMNSQSQSMEDITTSQILSQTQDVTYESQPNQYRNVLTQEEYQISKQQKRQLKWSLLKVSDQLQYLWITLNEQQQFCAYLMLQNLTLTHQINQERKICEGTFIHGPGGVGKSYLITFLLKLAQDMNFNYVTLCPTQQAVQNILNQSFKMKIQNQNVKTIHSFLKLTENQTIEKLYYHIEQFLKHIGIKKFENTNEVYKNLLKFRFENYVSLQKVFDNLDLIIVEEVSMMNPLFLTILDLYGQISRQCNQPFGGIQVFFFGDSYQLQPIQETRKQICYFDSIVMKKAYFTHMIELTESVRQKDDLDYFNNILQPIRKGIFDNDIQNFNLQIKRLKARVVPLQTIGQTPEILKEYEKKQKENQQIISLYFKNINTELENEKRAKRVIQQFEEDKAQGKEYIKLAQFRKFIYQPVQVSFGERQTNQEIISQLLGQDYEFNENVLDQPLSYYSHFLLLPVGIRNFIAREICKTALSFTENQEMKFNKQRAVDDLTLFKKAEVIIRKNVDKTQQISNGQFARVDDLYFDIEFNSLEQLKKLKEQQQTYIKQNNLYLLIRKIEKTQSFKFTQKELKDFKKECKKRNIMNVNNLRLRDISKAEKLSLYWKSFEPKLAKLILKIENVGRVELQAEDPKFIQKLLLPKETIYNNMQGIIESLESLREEMEKIKKLNTQEKRNRELWKFIKNENLIRLIHTEILTDNFNEKIIERAIKNMKNFLIKMPNEVDLQVHQFPINLGYARTIHTAQGATFRNIKVDLDMPEQNTPGLLYTALSRVQKMDDLYFQGKFDENLFKVRVPKTINEFVKQNMIEADKYLSDEKLRELKNFGITEIICSVNDYAEGIRNAFNELKAKIRREQQKI